MTAEIALVNRSALALAADSAVTLRIGSKYKTYNTAEKIFEYSCRQPIAMMVYNTAEFLGVPFDVLIRKHRDECNLEHETMKDVADHFISYLNDFDKREDEDKKYIAALLIDAYDKIMSHMRKLNNKRMRGEKVGEFIDELLKCFDQHILRYRKSPLKGFMDNKTREEFVAEYGEVCRQALLVSFPGAKSSPETVFEKAQNLAFAIAKSRLSSDICTGIVFGGFARKDLFPTLYYLEIDGIYFGQIKVLFRKVVDIDRAGDKAQIVPFAQKDMAERFIYGVDGYFRHDLLRFTSDLFRKVIEVKPDAFSAKEQREIKASIAKSFNQTLDELCEEERNSILDIVHFMSKKELAEMASALIEVTSAKRRFSTQEESVGGAIDVAVVSRSEGFVWIRRKHYFEREANPGYFARVFPRKKGQKDAKAEGGDGHGP